MEGRGGRGRVRGGGGGGGGGGGRARARGGGGGGGGGRGRARGGGGGGGRGGGGGGGGDHGWIGWGQPTQPWRPSNQVQQQSSNPVEPPVVPSPVQQPPPPTIAPATAATVESPTSSHRVEGIVGGGGRGGGGGGGDHGWRGRGRGWGQPTQPWRPSNLVQQPSSNPVEPPVVPSPVQQPPPPTIAPATAATVESPTSSHHVEGIVGGGGRGGGGGGDHGWKGRGRGWGQPTQPWRPSNLVQQLSSNPVEPPVVPSPVQQPPPPTIAPATAATVESPTSSHHVEETGDKRIPMRKPDKGGTNAVYRLPLLVNHFLVNFKSDRHILHYDVTIELEAPPEKGRPEKKISKSTRHMIKKELCSNNPSKFPPSSIAYDGEKNIFSAVELPTGNFTVELRGDKKVCSFIVTINLVKQLEFQKLSDYFSGNLPYVPRDILQGMDVVMKENPVRSMISVGRRFYLKQNVGQLSVGRGIIASRGFEQSLKPTSQGLSLCLDHSSAPFFESIDVIKFLKKHIKGFTLPEFNRYRRKVEAALKGLKVEVTHRTTHKIFIVAGLTSQDTGEVSFLEDDPKGKGPPQQVMLVNFFKRKYNKVIEHKDIPCLDVGKNNRTNYVPMEFCKLVVGQRYTKEIVERNEVRALKDESIPKPSDRNGRICEMVGANDGPCGGGIIDSFGINVNNNMTQVEGRVIKPPVLKLQDHHITVDDKCQWSLRGKKVVKAIPVLHWALVDFSEHQHQHQHQHQHDEFISNFIRRCGELGIQMQKPIPHTASMDAFRNFSELQNHLQEVQKIARGKLQIIVCVMARRDNGYGYLKWFSETTMGVITQCCLYSHTNEPKDQYLANLALKLNAKLGGSNVELIERLPPFEGKGHMMFIGADVNHPDSRNTNIPSIAAVVATVNWPAANRYATRIRPQAHRQEPIQNFGAMCLELVKAYVQENKVKPEKIVVFRDGVSEGQFDKVLNEELPDLKRALEVGAQYCPTITLIVAKKRHLTRMFPRKNNAHLRRSSSDANANVPPGTVVDNTVVHPSEFDFYLCSHHGTLGTSKPTHYHVLYDDHKFSSDQIQKLTFNLCFTFARCTKSISLVPPVYYADLAAYRGRLYCDAMAEAGVSAASPSPSSSAAAAASPSSSAAAAAGDRLNDVASYRLARALENMMFFI